MPTDDYIKRDEALFELYRDASAKDPAIIIAYRVNLCERIENIPAADVEPVKHGRWIDENPASPMDPRMRCSVCGHLDIPIVKWRFCPVCGAKMDKEEEDV